MQLFGFEINRKQQPHISSVVAPTFDDGSTVVSSGINAGAYFGMTLDIEGTIKGENDLIRRYREISKYADCDNAIEDIVNEAINIEEDKPGVSIVLDRLKMSDALKNKIREEFDNVLGILEFDEKGHDIFRTWYIDGKVYYHILLDEKRPEAGIIEMRQIDPRKIRKIKNVIKEPGVNGIDIIRGVDEYYLFNDAGITEQSAQGVKLALDSVVYVPSGLVDGNTGLMLSYLHKAIKPVNQLKMIEDAVVIYRISRAPERRIFYIDVGNLPKLKAEQYVNDTMNRFRNKIVYDATTGEINDTKKHLSLMEDFWMPRREGGKGTEITTLPGGCFSMDTDVVLTDGRILSIREIESELASGRVLWTYSCDEFTGEVKPGLISWAGVTQEAATVIQLTLSNGKVITCTPDHKFPIAAHGFVQAADLSIGESIISLHRSGTTFFDKTNNGWAETSAMLDHVICGAPRPEYITSDGDLQKDLTVISIDTLETPIQVGTLTIDAGEIYHAHHTFALAAGVFTKNSNLSDIADIEYFQNKLYQALSIPASRLQQASGFAIGRPSEITRDEVKFSKFIARLRKRFSYLFLDTLRVQLIAKNIISPDDWDDIAHEIRFNFLRDNYFAELKEIEILQNRLNTLQLVDPYVGKYYSESWVKKNILRLMENEIKEIDAEIATSPQPKQPELEQ